MGVHWKTKQTQKNLVGKSTLAHQCSQLSPVIQNIAQEVACPSGEQITNGGFETGDFTGWTRDPTDPNHWQVLTSDVRGGAPPEGSYLAQFKALDTDPTGPIGCPRATGTLQQDSTNTVAYECFVATSTFQVRTKWDTDLCSPVNPAVWKVEVLYTDDTSTTVDLTGDPQNEWVTHNLKTVLESGKTVKGIKFTATVDRCGGPDIGLTEVTIDACTLVP